MTIFKRPGSPHFYMDFTQAGVRHAKSTGTSNRREAVKVEAAERKKTARKPAEAPPQLTLGAAMARLQSERWSRTRTSAQTKARGERIVEMLGGPDVPLASVDSPAVSRMLSSLRAQGAKPGTCNRHLSTIRTLLLTAQREWGVLAQVPFFRLEKEPPGRLRTYSLEEEERIQTVLRSYAPPRSTKDFNPNTELADLLVVLADTGMRLGEAVNLESRDVNLDTGLISIWKNKSDRPRSVPMTSRVRAIVERRMRAEPRMSQDGVPRQARAFRLSSDDAEGCWRRRVKALPEFSDGTIHGWRHTYASRLVSLGVPLYTLQNLLGHSTPAMSARYAHLSQAAAQGTANLLDSLVKGHSEETTKADVNDVVDAVSHNGIGREEPTQPIGK